jgi:hypothetical protein
MVIIGDKVMNLINSKLKDLKESKINEEDYQDVYEKFIKLLAGIYERDENDQSAVDSIANYVIEHDMADDVSSESYIQDLESKVGQSGDEFKSVLAHWVISLVATL